MGQWLALSGVAAVLTCQALAAQALLAQPAHPDRSVWEGIYTPEQAERGKALYTRYCGSCHGEVLEGKTMAPRGDRPPQRAPGLANNEFLFNWKGMAAADLLERMRVSMPQDRPGSLSRQQNADILAYILRENGFPFGPRELPGQDPILADIKFTW